MNGIKQHTQRWKIIKLFNLGANDIASLLGVGFNDPSEIVENKIHGKEQAHSDSTIELMNRGTRYEDIVRKACSRRNDITIVETGLKHHKKYKFITASPDGYCRKGFLTEFKVRKELSRPVTAAPLASASASLPSLKIPMKYWVQMQVQMEVWNIPKCLYCENIIMEYPSLERYQIATRDMDPLSHGIIKEPDASWYWALKEYTEQYIERDTTWWDSVMPKILGYWSLVEQGRSSNGVCTRLRSKRKRTEAAEATEATEVSTRRTYLEKKDTMVQPYMLGNYIRNDPLMDWLNIYGPAEKRDTESAGRFFQNMIRNKNREFHGHVVAYVENKYPGSTYNICPCPFQTSVGTDAQAGLEPHKLAITFESLEKTKAAMKQEVPIIFNACFSVELPSYPYAFGGRADMLVLNKYLHSLIGVSDTEDAQLAGKYSIVAFKYATINLRADKRHLLNNAKQKVYKAHLWLLNSALGVEQGYVPNSAYVLGRKYDFKKRGVTHRINNAFEGVGTVDFNYIDSKYEEICRQALEWIQKVRSEEAADWDPMHPDSDTVEMYPNMKNSCDFPWHQYKQEIAHAIKEITLMYRCGPAIRDHAHKNGVTEWNELTPDSINYCAGKVMDQIMMFVNTNTATEATPLSLPAKRACIEFYMDFEAIGNMYDDFSTFPIAASKAMIFLIGVVVVDNVKGTKNYVSYLTESLDHSSEYAMVRRMLNDFRELREQYEQDFSPVYFWSNAENFMLKRAMNEFIVEEEKLVMIDLCKCFRDGGFILPGQMGYGLKEVAKLMKQNGMIETIWEENEEVSNGLNAMVEAVKTYKYRDAETRSKYFKDLINYNYVDCKVMEEIVEYLRQQPAGARLS